MAYTKYSLTPANNNAAPPDGAPEGMLPSAVNDTMRDMMAQIRDCGDGIRGGTYTMTAPVITGGSINGTTVGASSASTGAFTTLAYTGTLTGGTGVVNLGSGQFYKDASGNIGIGTSSPTVISNFRSITTNATTGVLLDAQVGGTIVSRLDSRSGEVALNSYGTLAFGTGSGGSSTERMRIDSSGNVGIGTSTITGISNYPTLELKSAAGGGIRLGTSVYQSYIYTDASGMTLGTGSAHSVNFVTGGTESMRIDSSGNLLVGTTSNAGRVTIYGAVSDSSGYSLRVRNSSGTESLAVRGEGYVAIPANYGITTASAANMYFGLDGFVYRSTSSARYKTNIKEYDKGLDVVLKLKPVYYSSNSPDVDGNTSETQFAGLIAEEVSDAGLKEFVVYNEEGQPDALHYGNMVALAFKAIQELKAIVDTQAARIAALESK